MSNNLDPRSLTMLHFAVLQYTVTMSNIPKHEKKKIESEKKKNKIVHFVYFEITKREPSHKRHPMSDWWERNKANGKYKKKITVYFCCFFDSSAFFEVNVCVTKCSILTTVLWLCVRKKQAFLYEFLARVNKRINKAGEKKGSMMHSISYCLCFNFFFLWCVWLFLRSFSSGTSPWFISLGFYVQNLWYVCTILLLHLNSVFIPKM